MVYGAGSVLGCVSSGAGVKAIGCSCWGLLQLIVHTNKVGIQEPVVSQPKPL